ncbi:hypothetical protein B7C42_01612 [Nocardia cerradoensis]|uniref:Uncharacterized protein n=1 Tax=Nocardia cerradoensis TaxID=85688 RepID=A0A231HCZ6_9NOCA|nr:hypothetical protein [Nocardia cerradoensis]OXR46638.1 hypothetical protein B7C42_01612 [Nocardia cerradoensis]
MTEPWPTVHTLAERVVINSEQRTITVDRHPLQSEVPPQVQLYKMGAGDGPDMLHGITITLRVNRLAVDSRGYLFVDDRLFPWLLSNNGPLISYYDRAFLITLELYAQRVDEVPQRVQLTDRGAAIVECGLSVRHMHELETGCSPDNLCAECRGYLNA